MLNRIWTVSVLTIFGVLSLVNMSGYALVIDSNEKTRNFLVITAIISVFMSIGKYYKLNKYDLLHGILMIMIFGGVSYIKGYKDIGVQYLTYYLTIYIVSNMSIEKKTMSLVNVTYALMGIYLLAVINFTTTLKGWNENTLSIIVVQMYLIFITSFDAGVGNVRFKKFLFGIVLILNILWLNPLKSRGAQLCAIIAAIFSIRFKWDRKLLKNKAFIIVMILLPFIISISTVIISKLSIYPTLNNLSIEALGKPIFNGRDEIWYDSYKMIKRNILLGHGEILSGFFHNSAVGCLYSYGIIGYVLYILVFYKILRKGSGYIQDEIVRKAMWMFIILMIEQSTENTIFQCGSMIMSPFVLLGIILGRINHIERENKIEHYRSDLQYRAYAEELRRLNSGTDTA